MGLVKNVLLAPYRAGAKVGNVLKVKPDDGLMEKISKRVLLNVVAPVTAVALVYGAIQLALFAAPVLPLLELSLETFGAKSLAADLVVRASAVILLNSAGATFFAGVSKKAMKENINFLTHPFKGSKKGRKNVTDPASFCDIEDLGMGVDNDVPNKMGRGEVKFDDNSPIAEANDTRLPAEASRFFSGDVSTESLLPPPEFTTPPSKTSGNVGLKL